MSGSRIWRFRAREFARFLAFANRSKPQTPFAVPAGSDRGEYEKEFAKAELKRSLRYGREVLRLGLGLKSHSGVCGMDYATRGQRAVLSKPRRPSRRDAMSIAHASRHEESPSGARC